MNLGGVWKWGWKTISGATLMGIALASSPLGVHLFGQEVCTILGAVGLVLNQVGVRAAIASGPVPPGPVPGAG